MGVAILNPQDCLKHPLSHMKHPRNPSACPNKQKKPVSNRTRRNPPLKQPSPSPPRAAVPVTNRFNSNNNVVGHVRILKRGEEIAKKTFDLVVEKPDLVSTRQIGPDPGSIPSQIRLPVRKSKTVPFYAGPVTMTSPPPSDVPLPAFFAAKKSVSLFKATDATNDIIRMLRLDIA